MLIKCFLLTGIILFLYKLFYILTDIYEIPPRIGKINNIQKFDAKFFDMPASEAHVLDPGFRILLEHTYEAIIDAGVNPAELQGTNTSVVTAINVCDT